MNRESPGETEVDAPRAVAELVRRAEAVGASDIHLHRVGAEVQVRFRLDGLLTPPWTLTDPLAERVLGRVKYLARLKTYQESLPQDGRIDRADVGAASDLRVSTYPTVTGEKIVIRLFRGGVPPGLTDLGLPESARVELERFVAGSAGLLLLTGPAGSGKTTTIYACLLHLAAQGDRQVITVEDPVEQVIPGIMQTEVNEAAGLDFARASRHLLRQDPQVLVIGEIRDEETARLALRASLTGHLVISTLHAGSCRGVFDRLLVLCPDRHLAAAAVDLVLNQRLVRRVCPSCHGSGCDACVRTGYRGRVPLAEWVRVDDAVRVALAAGDTAGVQPRVSLRGEAERLVAEGVTNGAEIGRIFQP